VKSSTEMCFGYKSSVTKCAHKCPKPTDEAGGNECVVQKTMGKGSRGRSRVFAYKSFPSPQISNEPTEHRTQRHVMKDL